ncbi:MAG: CocE/NonD family hydrolase [Gammaproteobacteria bacterium]|nr:CocE/NonD family hydrolase [Gammaproteobacteria bacterium]
MPDYSDLSSIDELEHVWIPMSDGVRLAARIWMPANALERPVPALLEFIPYRKRDFMRSRDEPMHRFYALHGYVSARVDVRGTGDSEGVLHDEYTAIEHRDAVEIIHWLAAQPWCDGRVGMTGISWGGFNALQVAALAPEPLGAIITLCAADDRYADDAHYKGGCLLNENMQWGSIFTLYNALPPDPLIVGERWREMWSERIDALQPFPAVWMRHPWRDEYWQHGSVCEDYAAIKCPVYAIGGWADGYTNAIPRLLAGLQVPRKGLIGPWSHAFPHDSVPGPQIGYLQEAVRWWDHWLKGIDNGVMNGPMLRAWMQDSVPPQPQYAQRPGRWVGENLWPSARIDPLRLYLEPGQLSEHAGEAHDLMVSSPHTLGVRGGEWCGFGADGESARDQRADDGGSLLFDTEPLANDLELLGEPELSLEIRCSAPVGFLVARLCEVAPSGASARISYGMLNLCHRDGHHRPEPLEPGRWYRIDFKLDVLGQRVPAGHRLRLALSTGYWPMIWPTPESVSLSVRTGQAWLSLPVRPACAADDRLEAFEAPVSAPGSTHKTLRHLQTSRTIEIDLVSNEMTYTLSGDGGEFGGAALARLEEIDLDIGYTQLKRYRIREDDPLSAQTELVQSARLQREGWSIRVECRTRLSATAEVFQFTGDVEAFESELPFRQRRFVVSIPRKLL